MLDSLENVTFSDLPRTCADAIAAGSPFYFSGIPCQHGHIAPRKVHNRICTGCEKVTRRLRDERDAALKKSLGGPVVGGGAPKPGRKLTPRGCLGRVCFETRPAPERIFWAYDPPSKLRICPRCTNAERDLEKNHAMKYCDSPTPGGAS